MAIARETITQITTRWIDNYTPTAILNNDKSDINERAPNLNFNSISNAFEWTRSLSSRDKHTRVTDANLVLKKREREKAHRRKCIVHGNFVVRTEYRLYTPSRHEPKCNFLVVTLIESFFIRIYHPAFFFLSVWVIYTIKTGYERRLYRESFWRAVEMKQKKARPQSSRRLRLLVGFEINHSRRSRRFESLKIRWLLGNFCSVVALFRSPIWII